MTIIKVQVALRAPMLVRCPEGNYYANYDPELEKIFREAKYFDRIGEQFDAKAYIHIYFKNIG